MITVNDTISIADVAAVAHGLEPVRLDPRIWERIDEAQKTAERLSATHPTYGRTTGVGANRVLTVSTTDHEHGLRLLRSHAIDAGEPLGDAAVRAMLFVRLAQLSQPGSGINPTVLDGLVRMLNENALPSILEFGAIGTADTAALAGTALTLMGERPASKPFDAMPPWSADSGLSFMSSSALTIGRACLATHELGQLIDANVVAFSLSFVGLRGNPSPHTETAMRALAAPGAAAIGAKLRKLLRGVSEPALIQDPFALRAFPAIQTPVLDSFERLSDLLFSLSNIAAENPLFVPAGNDEGVVHHGGFYQASLAVTIDSVKIALAQTAPTALSRIRMMTEPNYTGAAPFLAHGPLGASGIMMVEYVAASAYAEVQTSAAPSSITTSVVSRGTEDDASYASHAIVQLERSLKALRVIFACELIVAARLLRQQKITTDDISSPELRQAYSALTLLPQDDEDREMRSDLAIAGGLVETLADCLAQ